MVVEEDKMNSKIILIVGVIIVLSLILGGFFIKSNLTGEVVNSEDIKSMTLKVAIPCPGHASLIQNSLYNLNGVEKVEYTPITTFVVYYDSNKISEQEILAIDVFKDYSARKIS